MNARAAGVGVLAVIAAGCGARGDPMAPLRTVPPSLLSAEISQLGTNALVEFTPSAEIIDMGNEEEMTIERVELLMLTERYPALTASMLAQGLDRERGKRLEIGRRAIELAAEGAEARRVAEERLAAEEAAAAAGIELPPEVESDDEEPLEEQEPVSAEQLLLDGLPRNALREWREASIQGDILLEAAGWFDEAVDDLWDLLGMPTAIVDTRRPPALPRPSLVVEKAAQLARTHPYEGGLEIPEFLTRAAIVAAIPFENISDYVLDDRARIHYNIGTSSSGPVRTRYYFAVRAVDTEGRAGSVDTILSLAPSGVPLSPAELEVEITPEGPRLRWSAPAGDVWGSLIDTDEISYNIYRRNVGAEIAAVTILNDEPLTTAEYLDSGAEWDGSYIYEVRAVAAAPSDDETLLLVEPDPIQAVLDPADPTALVTDSATPTKESSGAVTPPVHVVDTFKPEKLGGLVAVRAASRITLRWVASAVPDLVGYRVYRRTLVDDPCDPRYMLEFDEEEAEATTDEEMDDEANAAADDEAADGEAADGEATDGEATDGEATDDEPDCTVVEAGPNAEAQPSVEDETAGDGVDTGSTDADIAEDQAGIVDDAGAANAIVDASDDDLDSSANRPLGAEDADLTDEPSAENRGEEGGTDDTQEADDEGEPGRGNARRRRGNELVTTGWDMLTVVAISGVRYTDPTADGDEAWEYAIEAVDTAGNVSPPAVIKVRTEDAADEQ